MDKNKVERPKTHFVIRGQKFNMSRSIKKELQNQQDDKPQLNKLEVFTKWNEQEQNEKSYGQFRETEADESPKNQNTCKLQGQNRQAHLQLKQQSRQSGLQNQKIQDFLSHRRVFTPMINDLSPPFTPTSPSPATGRRQLEKSKMIYPVQKPLKKQKNSNLVDFKYKIKQDSRTLTENLLQIRQHVNSSQTYEQKFMQSLFNHNPKKDLQTLETGASSQFANLLSHRLDSSFIQNPLIEHTHKPKLIQSPVFSRQKQRGKFSNVEKVKKQNQNLRTPLLTPPMSQNRPISFAQNLALVEWSQSNSMDSSRSKNGPVNDSVNASRNGTGMNLHNLLKRDETAMGETTNEFRSRISVSTNINKALMPEQQIRTTFQQRSRPENSSRLVPPANLPLKGSIMKTLDSSRYGFLSKSKNPSRQKFPKLKNQFDVSQFLKENEHEFERLNQSINILQSNSSEEDDLDLCLQSYSRNGIATEFPSIWQDSIRNPVTKTIQTTETQQTLHDNSFLLDDQQQTDETPAATRLSQVAGTLEVNDVSSPAKNSFLKSVDFTNLQNSKKFMYSSPVSAAKKSNFIRVNRSLERAKQVIVQQLSPIEQEKEEIEDRPFIRRTRRKGTIIHRRPARRIAPIDEAEEENKIVKYDFMNEMTPKPQVVDEMLDLLQYLSTRRLMETQRFSNEEIRLLINNTDHFIKMAKAQKENEKLSKQQMIAKFRIDYKGIKDRTDAQIRDIQDSLKWVYLGMIENLHDNVMTEDFLEKNSVILEMMEQNKNDPQFRNQLREARKETKEFLNSLIKSLNLRNATEESESDDSYDALSVELDFKNSDPDHPEAKKKVKIVEKNLGDNTQTPQVNIDFSQYSGPKEVDKETGLEQMKLRMQRMVLYKKNEQKRNKDYNTASFNLKALFDGRPTVIKKEPVKVAVQEESDGTNSEDSSAVDGSKLKKSREGSKMGNVTLGHVQKLLNLNQATPNPSSQVSPAGGMSKHASKNKLSMTAKKSPERNMSKKKYSKITISEAAKSPPQNAAPPKKKKRLRKLGKNETINFSCPGIQKFRELVAKHFLTIPLSKLESLDQNNLNITFALLMAHFKKTLEEILPSPSRHSIYLKYQKMDRNLYQNLFLHNMLSNIPALKDLILREKGFADKDRYRAIDCYKTDLNHLFGNYVEKLKFYKTAKQGKLSVHEESELNNEAMLQYYNSCYKNREVIVPSFVTFEKNVMYMSQNIISHKQALALKQYLIFTNHLEDKRVHKLILDSCKIQDESLAEILKGIDFQSERDDAGHLVRQYLSSFILSNSPLGVKSIRILGDLMTQLIELTINNVTNQPSLNKDNQMLLTNSLYEDGRRIMKLKLANFNLNDDLIVDNLCEMISLSRILQLFDVSWASLTVYHLARITESLIERSKSIRHINFSYNQLQFEKVGAEQAESHKVLENLYSLFEKAYVLCHVKLSGMRFGKKPLLELCHNASKVRLLMSIHLNDNEINSDHELMQEVLDIFGLREEDLVELNRQKQNQKLNFLQDSHEQDMLRKNREVHIDYKKIIKTHLRSDSPIKKNLLKGLELSENQQRKLYKDHVIMGKQSKVIEQHRAINLSAVHQGIGRTNDSTIDPFVITRKVNYPEFIFNQKIKNDDVRGLRYFQKDHELQWKLSKTNECFICEKWKYTIIFFEKGMFSKNPELVEIFDEEFIDSMRQEFNQNYLKYKTLVPIICGSVVNRGFNQGTFDRKLKMMRASLFTLLSIAHSRDFVQNKLQSKFIKEAIIKFNQFDSDNVMNEINIYDKIDGWNEVLHDKCNLNELVDVTSVNQPNLLDGYIQYKDIYVYASFLPPGYHQMIIYDPQQERAFCKDIVISLNQKDFYPEFPLQTGYEMPKTVQNVWRTWLEDTQDDALKSFISDTQSEEFDVYRFIKDQSDANKCLDILRDNFEIYKIYHKECLVGSSKYPQIDWVNIWEQISKTQEDPQCKLDKKRKFRRAELELQFISATRFDDTAGLKSAMQRQELLDFVLRSAKVFVNKSYPKESISDHLLEFLNVYMKAVYDKSEIVNHRKAIRSSQRLNDLLFSNRKGLEIIFNEFKNKRGFTIESAQKLFGQYEQLVGIVSIRKIEEAFLFSMMTVLNEIRNMNKYNYLVFVEFQEMLCRIAIVAIQEQDTIEYKVNLLLAMIYEHRYASEIWSKQKNPYVTLEEVDANNDNNFF